jgi:hypothetical protein
MKSALFFAGTGTLANHKIDFYHHFLGLLTIAFKSLKEQIRRHR